MAGLTLSGPDILAWAPEGREGRSQEARRASSKKLGPGGAPKLLVSQYFLPNFRLWIGYFSVQSIFWINDILGSYERYILGWPTSVAKS